MDNPPRTPTASYSAVDLNTTGTTTLFDPTTDSLLTGAYLDNTGSSAVVLLELTDGSDTATLTPGQTAGDDIAFSDRLELDGAQLLAANVTTIEGSDLSETAVATHSDT